MFFLPAIELRRLIALHGSFSCIYLTYLRICNKLDPQVRFSVHSLLLYFECHALFSRMSHIEEKIGTVLLEHIRTTKEALIDCISAE